MPKNARIQGFYNAILPGLPYLKEITAGVFMFGNRVKLDEIRGHFEDILRPSQGIPSSPIPIAKRIIPVVEENPKLYIPITIRTIPKTYKRKETVFDNINSPKSCFKLQVS